MLHLILALAAVAAPSSEAALHFAWVRHGVDALGRSAFEKVSLQPNGALRWSTAARGGECPGEAGEYELPADDGERDEISGLARAAVRELQAEERRRGPPPKPRKRESRLLLSVFDQGKGTAVEVSKATPAYDALMSRLADLKSRAKPVSAVRFTVSRERKGRITARFEQLGREGFPFVIPREAGDAFTVSGRPGRYANPPARLQGILSPGQGTMEVTLAGPDASKGATEVHFSNAIVLHHFDPASIGVPRPETRRKRPPRPRALEQPLLPVPAVPEVWLCGRAP